MAGDVQWWLELAKQGGAFIAPFLLGALIWLERDRQRVIADLKEKDERLASLSEQSIAVATELKILLFNKRRAS